MDDHKNFNNSSSDIQSGEGNPPIHSLRDLIDQVTGRNFQTDITQDPSGIAEAINFPFFAVVGQKEMRLALLLAVINPAISGVLLIGPRGTGKTTCVRSLLDLLPKVQRSSCFYGCLPEDILAGGIDAVCPACAKKFGEGLPLTIEDRVRLVELPLFSQLDDVIGGFSDSNQVYARAHLRRGILALADRNILYIDEVNLLKEEIINAILDAAAQGRYSVRNGPISASLYSRFTLVGSMNPEEGNLRPQISDRFGLRVIVHGLQDTAERLEAYRRACAFQNNPKQVINEYREIMGIAEREIINARELLPRVRIPNDVAAIGIKITQQLQIDSLRAEITMFEAARAYAAAEGRIEVNLDDIKATAPFSLRLRRSNFITKYFEEKQDEDRIINDVIKAQIGK